MQNIAFQVHEGTLVITIDLNQELGTSASGKSVIIATTGGNVPVPGYENIKIGLNVFRPQHSDRGNGRAASRRDAW